MTHNHLLYPGPNPGKLHPSFCAGSLPAHISPLNTGHGGYCGSILPAHNHMRASGRVVGPCSPIIYVVVVPQENLQPAKLGFNPLFPGWDRVPQVAVRHVWAPPRFFFEMWYPAGSLGHCQPPKRGRQRSDMTFRQNDHCSNGLWSNQGKSSPFFDAQV